MRRRLSHEETQTVFDGFPLNGTEDAWYKKWMTICRNARHYDYADCYLTFEDYLSLAVEAGITNPEQIGQRLGQFQLGRVGDTGDYVRGNCRFILREQNIQEWRDNGGKAVSATANLGRRRETHAGIEAMALKMVDISSKNYEVFSPDGTRYAGRNLKLLCQEFNLNGAAMSLVLNGHRNHHKGWTGHYVEGETA